MLQAPHVIPLVLSYKGSRNYLQGGDLYNAIASSFSQLYQGDSKTIQLLFHRFARQQCDLYIVGAEEGILRPEECVCDGTVEGKSGKWIFWLLETGRPVTGRQPFDEDGISRNAIVSDKQVSLEERLEYSPIEIVVALTKHLHNLLYPLAGQRWIFSKLELSRLLAPEDNHRVRVKLLTNLHNRITKSEVWCGVELLGHIYFSAIAK